MSLNYISFACRIAQNVNMVKGKDLNFIISKKALTLSFGDLSNRNITRHKNIFFTFKYLLCYNLTKEETEFFLSSKRKTSPFYTAKNRCNWKAAIVSKFILDWNLLLWASIYIHLEENWRHKDNILVRVSPSRVAGPGTQPQTTNRVTSAQGSTRWPMKQSFRVISH